MNEEINKIFEQWKQFLSWCYENNDKTTEIHRDNLERVMAYTRQLENIIKELEKYMENYIEVEGAPINERIKIEFKELLKMIRQGSDKE